MDLPTDQFDEAWDQQYAAGRALNRYPYDLVVTATARYFSGERDPRTVNVLDLGSGAGNHALFFARLGFNVTCVDVSETAMRIARQRFDAEGLTAQFHTMRFADIDVLERSFDLVLDRGALCCSDFAELRSVIMPAIRRRMGPNAVFLSVFVSTDFAVRPLTSADAPGYTRDDLAHDTGAPLRMTRVDRAALDTLFTEFRIVQLYHHTWTELFVAEGEPALGALDEYVVVSRGV